MWFPVKLTSQWFITIWVISELAHNDSIPFKVMLAPLQDLNEIKSSISQNPFLMFRVFVGHSSR